MVRIAHSTRSTPRRSGLSNSAMSFNDRCVCRRMFSSRIVARMALSAETLTAGLNPQNSLLSRTRFTRRGRNPYPRKSNLTFG